jgi:hypothetical protein
MNSCSSPRQSASGCVPSLPRVPHHWILTGFLCDASGLFTDDLRIFRHHLLSRRIIRIAGTGLSLPRVASHLNRTRDAAAAKAFFPKALKRLRQPRTITLDGFEPTHSALRRLGMRNEFNFRWDNPVRIRCCQYLIIDG